MLYPVFRRLLFLSLLSTNHLAASPDSPPPLLVIGFMGGYVAHTNAIHQEVQVASRLREQYPSRMDVEIFENHSGPLAHQKILGLLDTNHDGALSADAGSRQPERRFEYGHWGNRERTAVIFHGSHDLRPLGLLGEHRDDG